MKVQPVHLWVTGIGKGLQQRPGARSLLPETLQAWRGFLIKLQQRRTLFWALTPSETCASARRSLQAALLARDKLKSPEAQQFHTLSMSAAQVPEFSEAASTS